MNLSNSSATFSPPLVAGMRAVRPEVFRLPDQIVGLPALLAIGPEVRPPEQQRRLGRPRFALDLILDQPADHEGRLIGIGLGIQVRRGIPGVDAAGEVGDAEVGESLLQLFRSPTMCPFNTSACLGKSPRYSGAGKGLLHPGHLHLLRRDACLLQSLVEHFPRVASTRVRPNVRRLAALRPIDDDDLRGLFGIGVGEPDEMRRTPASCSTCPPRSERSCRPRKAFLRRRAAGSAWPASWPPEDASSGGSFLPPP